MNEPVDRHAPKQARSTWTRERLLDVLSEMLAEQSLHDISLAELAARADVTIGAIYGRFGGKQQMAVAGFERFADDAISRMRSWASDPRRATESPREIVWAWVSGASDFGRRRSPMRSLVSTLNVPEIAAAEQRIVACAVAALVEALAPHLPADIEIDEVEHDLAFGVIAAHAVLRSRTLIAHSGSMGFTDKDLLERLTDLLLETVELRSRPRPSDSETSG